MHFAMMDHERPTFLMHTRTRQTPMRNEGERGQGGGWRESEVMRKHSEGE